MAVYCLNTFCTHSIPSTSPGSHAVVLERDQLYGSYSKDQVRRQPSGPASASELFRRVGYWAGGGSRGDVACDTGKLPILHTCICVLLSKKYVSNCFI
jgi:hypothetical protein